MPRPHHRWRTNHNYHPWESRLDLWIQCNVCGYWLDDERTTETERFGALTQVVTGTVYHPTTPGVEGLATKEKQTITNVSAYSACPLCGSGNWRHASGPEGLRL